MKNIQTAMKNLNKAAGAFRNDSQRETVITARFRKGDKDTTTFKNFESQEEANKIHSRIKARWYSSKMYNRRTK
jgi:hypothetical protein